MSSHQHAPAALYPRERPGTHFTGGWVGPRAGLNGREYHLHRDSIPDRPTRSSVAIPTELPGPLIKLDKGLKFTLKIALICSYMFRSLNTTIIGAPSLESS